MSQEEKFKHEQEVEFKIFARRNKLLGLWVADQLGIEGLEAEAYAQSVVLSDLLEPGEEDVFAKVRADLDAKGVAVSDQALRVRMVELQGEARAQIMSRM